MRRLSRAAVFLLLLILTSAPAAEAQGRLLTYDQAFGAAPADRVLAELPTVVGWLDDERYLELRDAPAGGGRLLYAVGAADGRPVIYLDYREIEKRLPTGVDAADPAAATEDFRRLVYAHDNDLYYYDVRAQRARRLTATPSPERNPRFSPDGRWIAYTRDNNLFAYDLAEGREHQYTTDGSDTVYNGWASWVYFEEIFGRASQYAAFWWSPDSTRLAFMRFDDDRVPEFPIYHASGPHGRLERQRFPKAGDPNPYVAIGVVRVRGGPVMWMDFEERADHYIAWPFWTPDGRTLTVQWMNRGQDTIRLYDCDPATGKKALVLEERQDAWVTFFEDLHHLGDGAGFLLRSDADGWDHLYLYGRDGALLRRFTSGAWRVTAIARVVEERNGGWIYFLGQPGATWDSHLMRIRLDGGGLEQLTAGEGVHAARVSPAGRYFIATSSTLDRPPRLTLHRADGSLVRTLGDARTPAAGEYAWGRTELFTIPSGDGFDLPAYWILPPDFDPARRYPVIFSVYGGPGAPSVRNRWVGLPAHYWAQRGVITISVDHRGSGHFGKQGMALMHRNLGRWEIDDLIAAAKWVRAQPFVDPDKVGIVGNSYGGYVTMLAMTYGGGHFNFGQAGASVTDWRLYDTVYTERYMDTPEENPDGYRRSSVLNWIDRYRGGLRIIHGTVDDNVHMQHSLQVIEWLTANDRRFDLMIYPGSRHGLQPMQRPHATREAHDFWVRHLLDGRLPAPETTAGRY